MSAFLNIDSIHLAYPGPTGLKSVVNNLSFSLSSGEIGCLLGASGCGKTTVLRAIAGFEPVRSGQISLGDRVLSSADDWIEPEERHVGMMFQDYALFPHLTVEKNISFGLRRHPRAFQSKRVHQMLELVGLTDKTKQYPHELSGGQQQRVALARALAPNPSLLLLDEPFSNLDVDTRERLAFEVRDILKETGVTALLVTHNQAEAFAIADKIGIMHQGGIVQWDTPYGLHHSPINDFVADFIRRQCLVKQRQDAYLRGDSMVQEGTICFN